MKHVLITGGAGYIGSALCGFLLERGHRVTVLDQLLFGGESILGYLGNQRFRFVKADVCEPESIAPHFREVDQVVHLAAIVGFPACQQIGPQVARRYNVEATRNVVALCREKAVERLILASTYSNYGLAPDGQAVDETSPLNPQSLYAETKIEAEREVLANPHGSCQPVVLRFATLFGISPRTRFDLIVNQFVLEAISRRALVIYQRGYSRSFVHVRDVVRAIALTLEAPAEEVRGQIFNVGSSRGNYTKEEIVRLVQKHVPGTTVAYKDLTFGGDMRDIRVSFEKIERRLGFKTELNVEQGVIEVRDAIVGGLIRDPASPRYRNAQFIVQ
jgi:nucleoside-diphosphate-sugar epimerase